ncbi:MAG: glycoside hydrolase family 31 protein [Vicinamibacterales bacterium]
MTLRRRPLLLPLLLLLASSPAAAQWTSLGEMPAPSRVADGLAFRNAQGIVSITAAAPDIVRVRFSPSRDFGRDHSYAIVNRTLGDPQVDLRVGRRQSHIVTPSLTVSIQHAPFRISVADASGNDLDADDAERGIAFSGRAVRVWKRLRDDEQVYGFGEKTGRLNKRGRQLGGYSYTMWNSDTFAYETDTDPIYVSVPFYLVLRGGRTHGIFLDNTFRSNFDVGHTSPGLMSFGAEGGELNYYLIYGPEPKRVIQRYTEMTGRMPLPPRWVLGYHQCRYSYYPDSRVRFIAQNFRERRIPADVIWLDIHYLDGYNPFTWDRERFPDPPGLVRDLRRDGFRTVTIVDAHPKKEVGYAPYDSGLAGDHFVKNPDGSVYEAPVWPSQATKSPAPSVFPDFSKPAAREWWGGLYKSLTDIGIAGIWNDMNEPAVFNTPTGTMPLDVRHAGEGQPTDHREIHNVYGLLMTQSTYEGLRRLRPDERPFILTRASFAGGQRWSAIWPGDNISTWEHLRATIPMLTGMGLSGLTFVGSDIGGFAGAPSAELYTRWLQAGVFYPFMRTHTTLGTPDQEPWSYGAAHEAYNRAAIELRYQLLPHIYNVMAESAVSGLPAMRPLVLEYPDDQQTWALDNAFMFGGDLLIAPVLNEAERERDVYLPKGDWYDFWTGTRTAGGANVRTPVTLERIPIFVRGGAFIFRQPVVQHTGEMPGQPLEVHVFPAPSSEAVLYEDDGETMAHEKGQSMRRRFRQSRTDAAVTIDVGAPEGPFRPAARSLVLWVRSEGEPRRVSSGSTTLTRHPTPQALASQAAGWTVSSNGFVIVKQPDEFAATTVLIER